jgi:hypothetical protein
LAVVCQKRKYAECEKCKFIIPKLINRKH